MSSGETSPVSLTPVGTSALGTHVHKYGSVIPIKIFVGGITTNTVEQELKDFFSIYGTVKGLKIIVERADVYEGYGLYMNAYRSYSLIKRVERDLKFY